jgi:hypothetical protein
MYWNWVNLIFRPIGGPEQDPQIHPWIMPKGIYVIIPGSSHLPLISPRRQLHRRFSIPIAGIMQQRLASDARMLWAVEARECPPPGWNKFRLSVQSGQDVQRFKGMIGHRAY